MACTSFNADGTSAEGLGVRHLGWSPSKKRGEYSFESTVWEKRDLTEVGGKLGEFCEKNSEFALAHE